MEDKKYLKIAIEQAKESVKEGGFPAGAVIVKDGEVIAKGLSLGSKENDPTMHAEADAIRKACRALGTTDLSDCVLYDSLEPCLMCFSASNWSKIPKIVFGCKKTKEMADKEYYEGASDIFEINKLNNNRTDLVYISDYEDEVLESISEWEKKLP